MRKILALILLCVVCCTVFCGCGETDSAQEKGYEIAIERFLNALINEDYTYEISSNTPVTPSDEMYEEYVGKVTRVFGCTEKDLDEIMNVDVDVHCNYSDCDEEFSAIVVNIDGTYRAFLINE